MLALFAILCAKGILPWQILDISPGKGIDATCYDERNQQEIQVELKYILSKGNWKTSYLTDMAFEWTPLYLFL